MALTESEAVDNLASRLRDVHVDLRDDLEVSRHLFNGDPSYIIRDPVSFKSHRFSLADYQVLAHIDSHAPLGKVFEGLVQRGLLEEQREQEFYEFVLSLHRMGLLSLPITDGAMLYRRYKAGLALKRYRRAFSYVYLDIPLWNPDAFLSQTAHLVKPLFTRGCFVVWAILAMAALAVVVLRWRDLASPLSGLIAADSLVIMWFVLTGLKLLHELGHAYACKIHGLQVPTLGVYLMAGVPCAYVDASASWGLPSRRQRVTIALAGMYVETCISIIALFVWALTPPGIVNSIAYRAVFLASAVTILFNINPLMKYDGYFVLCDLAGIPNLGQRARDVVLGLVKRWLLGIGAARPAESGWPYGVLVSYGLAAPFYRAIILVSIMVLLASRFYLVGLLVGSIYLVYTVTKVLQDMTGYLWRSPETAPVRGRAVALSILILCIVPTCMALIPVRLSVQTPAVVLVGDELPVRAETAGFLTRIVAEDDATISVGGPLVELTNDVVTETLLDARVRHETAKLRRDALQDQPGKAAEEDLRVGALAAEVEHYSRQLDGLTSVAPKAGRVILHVEPRQLGQFIPVGGEIATIVAGQPEVRTLLTADQFACTSPQVGQTVECRVLALPGVTCRGVIDRIYPAGHRMVPIPALTHLGGGDIAVRTDAGETTQPYFLVIVRLGDEHGSMIQQGMRATVRLPSRWEPIAFDLYRRVTRFLDTLAKS